MPATNPGTTNLAAWWALDEESGDRADSHTGGHTLTDVNTVGYAAGKKSNAADLESSSSEVLEIADNASLSGADVGFTWGAWVKLESLVNGVIMAKFQTGGNNREYLLFYNHNDHATAQRFSLAVSGDGSATVGVVDANTFGAPSTGTWYFVVAYHDPTANTIGISVNDGAFDTTAWTVGIYDGAAKLAMGCLHTTNDTTRLYYLDGLIDEAFVYRGRVLTGDEIEWLYNSGSGRSYADVSASAGNPLGLFAAQMRAMYAYGGVSVG